VKLITYLKFTVGYVKDWLQVRITNVNWPIQEFLHMMVYAFGKQVERRSGLWMSNREGGHLDKIEVHQFQKF